MVWGGIRSAEEGFPLCTGKTTHLKKTERGNLSTTIGNQVEPAFFFFFLTLASVSFNCHCDVIMLTS